MASATGIPENINAARGVGEDEPLLGRRGDASQMDGAPLYKNLWIGTAPLAQAGIWILTAIIWGAVFTHPLIKFFSPHPLLNSTAFLLTLQATLLLQPTHTPQQKKSGTLSHALLHAASLTLFILGLTIIEINKFSHNGTHFESPHAILGLTFYILIILQALVGITQYYVPSLYGGVDNAKKIYKYHRGVGYVILLLGLATVSASSWTTYSLGVLHIEHWAVVVASVIVLVGVLPRVKLEKFGYKRRSGRLERLGS